MLYPIQYIESPKVSKLAKLIESSVAKNNKIKIKINRCGSILNKVSRESLLPSRERRFNIITTNKKSTAIAPIYTNIKTKARKSAPRKSKRAAAQQKVHTRSNTE